MAVGGVEEIREKLKKPGTLPLLEFARHPASTIFSLKTQGLAYWNLDEKVVATVRPTLEACRILGTSPAHFVFQIEERLEKVMQLSGESEQGLEIVKAENTWLLILKDSELIDKVRELEKRTNFLVTKEENGDLLVGVFSPSMMAKVITSEQFLVKWKDIPTFLGGDEKIQRETVNEIIDFWQGVWQQIILPKEREARAA